MPRPPFSFCTQYTSHLEPDLVLNIECLYKGTRVFPVWAYSAFLHSLIGAC